MGYSKQLWAWSLSAAVVALAACGSDDGMAAGTKHETAAPPATNTTSTTPGTTTGSSTTAPTSGTGTSTPASPGSPGTSPGVAGTGPAVTPTQPGGMPGVPPAAGGAKPPAMGGAAGAPAMPPPMMPPFTGPEDGDPAKPMVAIDGLKCGALAGGFGAAPQSVKITNRDVVVAYPCAHEGAAVTFFLFLHGTLQEAQKVSFTMNAFAIHKLIDSHNVIMALPKAVGTQWGNGDNGADKPHLVEVVDWVYKTFGEKFSIRSMWAQGGSWGAAYLAGTFACDPQYQDRLKGIQLIVGGGCPRCSNRLSCVVGQQELQLGNGMMLTPEQKEMYAKQAAIDSYAQMHGCQPMMGPTDVGNTKMWQWPNCQKGWTHSYFMAPGQHADAWDMAAVLKMTEDMKGTEK